MAQQEPREGRLRPARRLTLTEDVYESIKTLVMDHILRPRRAGQHRRARPASWTSPPPRSARRSPGWRPTAWSANARWSGYTTTPLLSRAEFDDLFDDAADCWRRRHRRAGRHARLRRSPPNRIAAEAAASIDVEAGDGYRRHAAFTALDARFHDLIAERVRQPTAARQPSRRLHSHLHLHRLYFPAAGAPDTNAEHQRIAAAIVAGDAGSRRRRRCAPTSAPPGNATCPPSTGSRPRSTARPGVTHPDPAEEPPCGSPSSSPASTTSLTRPPASRSPACWSGSATPSSSRRPDLLRADARQQRLPGRGHADGRAASSTSSTATTPIVAPSGSCVAMVRDQYPRLRPGQPPSVAARTYELSELLVDVLGVTDVGARFPHRVTYHPTCHGLRHAAPRRPAAAAAARGARHRAGRAGRRRGVLRLRRHVRAEEPGRLHRDARRQVRQRSATPAPRCVAAADNSCLAHIGGGLSRRPRPASGPCTTPRSSPQTGASS